MREHSMRTGVLQLGPCVLPTGSGQTCVSIHTPNSTPVNHGSQLLLSSLLDCSGSPPYQNSNRVVVSCLQASCTDL
jgi:hypothetical protein